MSANIAADPVVPAPGSEEEFITEHYWGYARQRDNSTVEYRVSHPQWPVWQATDAEFDCDVGEFYGAQFADALKGEPTSTFVAEGSAIEVYRGEHVKKEESIGEGR